ncbi:dTDP-4-dehydrorhamnose reductase [Microbacterium sp. HA-8]|uniref:dTDP-4-dehydrorhamnose reductase n=1 Tax=Microbacterium sp. HA-8 TaxID=3234200 RepID=UPI0038F7876E
MVEDGTPLRRAETPIPGLTVWDIPVHGDQRGWFKENWQREKMVAAGLPDFGPVQNNISFNKSVGTTRGLHAEPWDKWVSVATGRVFGAWVDLREGPGFGATFTVEIDPTVAVFVPRGVANGFQTLEPNTAYSYLVNDHWSSDASYTFVNLADRTLNIPWPIALDRAVVSPADAKHPPLSPSLGTPTKKTLVIGRNGQLGSALRNLWGGARSVDYVDRDELDITSTGLERARVWNDYSVVVNAAAYTAVDAAETPTGRRDAWAINAAAVENLARICRRHALTLVHVSTDYVFDGDSRRPYREDDPVCPIGVYGQSKAAGDLAAQSVPSHFIVRTSWVIGGGTNFVRTMARLADDGKPVKVVTDQLGRLTFAEDLAAGIAHLIDERLPPGIYNVTNAGEPTSWARIAQEVYRARGQNPELVSGISTAEYTESRTETRVAARPAYSVLDLSKVTSSGFTPADHLERLATWMRENLREAGTSARHGSDR